MNGWNKKFFKRFTAGMIGYTVMLTLWVFIVNSQGNSIWSYLATLLPLVPAVYAMYNVFQNVRAQDELEQKIQLESVLITMFALSTFAFTYGLLEYASLVPNMHTFLFAPGAIAIWGISSSIIRQRYQ